jgi:dipeptidyl aminopeptidase/acylaminoacyl peptidase
VIVFGLLLANAVQGEPASPPVAAAGSPAEKLPLAAFAHLPFVEYAEISPDGTHWAGLLGVNGIQVVAILNLFDKTEKIARVALPDGTEADWIHWVNADNVLIGLDALQSIEGEDLYITRTAALNRISGKLTTLLWDLAGQNAGDVLWFPHDNSSSVLISGQNSVYESEEFWPAVYSVDVTNGRHHSIVSPHAGVTEWGADSAGTVRIGIGYDDSKRTSRLLYRSAGGRESFKVIDRADSRKRESLNLPFMFLPGGDHALVVHDNEQGMSSIYEVDLATQTQVRQVYSPSAGEVDSLVLSSDGSTLLGVSDTSAAGGMHWMDSNLAMLQRAFDKTVDEAQATILSLSDDRRSMLVRIGSASTPGGIYYYSLNDLKLRRLATINELIGTQHLAPVKVISYPARDGLAIEGLLTLPVGRDPHKLPFIVMPHGGPWAQDTLVYDYWVQFLANRGYAVLQPNFRGSTGYGTEFLRKGEGQLGLAMQDDISDGVRWAVSQGLADAGRVCILGGSYGGYAAMWGIARDPDLYRCAISIAGVSSLKREVNDFANDLHGNKYRDDWQRMTPDFDAVSPLNAVERIKTPLLLIHGKKDITVAHSQSVKMYDRMRKAGKTVEFVSLPQADHYYTRQDDRVALLTAIETFLAKYNPAD